MKRDVVKRDVLGQDGSYLGYDLSFDRAVVAYPANPAVDSAEFQSEKVGEKWLREIA